MRKVIFSINITINGTADHNEVIADDELHDFYTNLLKSVDIILFGRKTYQLMESFWPVAHEDSRSTQSMLKFADKINSLTKIVLSRKLKNFQWENSKLFKGDLKKEILRLKKQNGKNISVGGLTLATELTNLGLIDEYWFLVQPMISGRTKKFFNNLNKRTNLKLISKKIFDSGVVALHYRKN